MKKSVFFMSLVGFILMTGVGYAKEVCKVKDMGSMQYTENEGKINFIKKVSDGLKAISLNGHHCRVKKEVNIIIEK